MRTLGFTHRVEQRRARWLWPFLTIVLSAVVSGCSNGAVPETFDLTAVGELPAGRTRGQVVVTEPSASVALDSNRIVVRTAPESIAYLSGAQWSGRLPAIVQTRLVQSFENAKLIKSVGQPGQGLAADYSLTTEIRSFEIDVQHREALVEIVAKIVAEQSGRIVAAQLFSARVPGAPSDGAQASHVLDQALGQVMRAIVHWTSAQL